MTCTAGMPKFSVLHVQGSPATKAPPGKSKGTGQEDKSAWALEVALDVETAHAMAPEREHPARRDADRRDARRPGPAADDERRAVRRRQPSGRRHLAELRHRPKRPSAARSRSCNLRHAFVSAQRAGVTVLASSGDGGTANTYKEPVKNPRRRSRSRRSAGPLRTRSSPASAAPTCAPTRAPPPRDRGRTSQARRRRAAPTGQAEVRLDRLRRRLQPRLRRARAASRRCPPAAPRSPTGARRAGRRAAGERHAPARWSTSRCRRTATAG